MRFLLFLLIILLTSSEVQATVEVTVRGRQPVVIEDVYRRSGVPYVAVADLLSASGLTGHWDSVNHSYRIRTARGWAILSPATSFLRIGDEFYPLQNRPLFIDGRLRVDEHFIQAQLAQLAGRPVFYRNLAPDGGDDEVLEAQSLDQLFGRLLSRERRTRGPLIRAIAIDPGHGGLDTGVIAPGGYNEKLLTYELAEGLARLLRQRLGIPVYLSRSGDYDVSVEQRLGSASREDVDLWILLHAQGAFSQNISGIDLLIRSESDLYAQTAQPRPADTDHSLLLARQLAKSLDQGSFAVRGIYRSSYLALGRGDLPTVQIEVGYLSNPEQLRLLRQGDYRNRLIQALFEGIEQYALATRE